MKPFAWLAIARKDISDAIRNMYILFAVLLPIGLSLLFGWIIPSNGNSPTLDVVVYDPGSSQFVAQLRTQPNVNVISAASPEDAQQRVKQDAIGALILPANFDSAIAAKQQPELEVYFNSNAGGGGLTAFRQLIETQVWGLVGQSLPAKIVLHDVNQPAGDPLSSGSISASLLVMILIMSLAMAGAFVVPTLLVEEKERRTLLALQVSPAGPADIIAGKALAGMFYALIAALIILTLNEGWQGQWPLTLLVVVLGALFIILIGLLMGSWFSTTNQVNTWSSIIMLLLLIPSWGGMLQLPASLEAIFQFIPTYHLGEVIGLAIGHQATWDNVALSLFVLSFSIVVAFALVVWRIQRETAG